MKELQDQLREIDEAMDLIKRGFQHYKIEILPCSHATVAALAHCIEQLEPYSMDAWQSAINDRKVKCKATPEMTKLVGVWMRVVNERGLEP